MRNLPFCNIRARIRTSTSLRVSALIVGLVATACQSGAEIEDELVASEQSAIKCGSDNRTAVSTLTAPRGAVGRLLIDGVPGCSGTVIGPNKVLTAQHCFMEMAPNRLQFQPQFGIVTSGTGPVTANVTRVVRAQEFDGTQTATSDWALLTLDRDLSVSLGSNYQTMGRTWISGTPATVKLMGYHGDLFSNRPGLESSCTINAVNDFAMYHNCDVEGGASGGPIFTGTGALVGVQSGHGSGTCGGTSGNTAANGRYFAFAPDNTVGLATSYLPDGRNRVWATDRDWTLIAFRTKTTTDPSSSWTPWDAFDSGFNGARKIAASNLQDNREVVWVITSAGELKLKWQTSLGGAWSTTWTTQSTPTTIKDIAVTGGSGNRTQLFVLGTNNTLYTSYKTGDSNSAWSSWVNLGSSSGASTVAAVRWSGMSVAFVASSSGMTHTWGNDGSFVSLQSLGTSTGGFRAVSAGLLQDGRIHLQGVNGSGAYLTRTRLADGSWSAWAGLGLANPPNTTGFVSLATGRVQDGREHLLAVASTGEIYQTWQLPGGFANTWVRFYK